MSKIQVEVRFTDKLESIRVDGQEMEIPNAIKAKSVEEWFEPAAGRVNWDGLGAEMVLYREPEYCCDGEPVQWYFTYNQ